MKFILLFILIGTGPRSFGQSDFKNLVIEFSEIDSIRYMDFKKASFNNCVHDTAEIFFIDSSCKLITQSDTFQFSCRTEYEDRYYYKGYLPAINSHVFTYCGMAICETFLIQKYAAERNYLFSPYDSECEVPVFSKDENKFLAYASSVFISESCISLYKRKSKTENFDFEKFESIIIVGSIVEVIWIDNTTIALIIDEYGSLNYHVGKIK